MPEPSQSALVDDFLCQHISSVPHLEALLLLRGDRERRWTIAELSQALFIPAERAAAILRELEQRGFARQREDSGGEYWYHAGSVERENMLDQVQTAYRRELVRISKLIHARSSALGEFARAFDLRRPS
jgi:sugar-specific transcriptional regulator TrmB